MDKQLPWRIVEPDTNGYWINQSESDFETLWPLGDKKNKGKDTVQAIFNLYSLGINTARDDWMYDHDPKNLAKKVKYFINFYQSEVERWQATPESEKGQTDYQKERYLDSFVKTNIKWASNLKRQMLRGKVIPFNKKKMVPSLYRPFRIRSFYYETTYTESTYQMPRVFPTGTRGENVMMGVMSPTQRVPFTVFILDTLTDLNFYRDPIQCFPLYRYTDDGARVSNITRLYRERFSKAVGRDVSDEEIFYYIYAVLHHPVYRETYKIDLQQNLPAVPMCADFDALLAMGRELGDIHLHFDAAEPFNLQRVDTDKLCPLPKLKSYPAQGRIVIDEATELTGIPKEAWEYRLGNRTAIDWALEGYKAKKLSFDNGDVARPESDLYQKHGYAAYQFTAEIKEECIGLLARVVTVALKTKDLVDKIGQLAIK